MTRENAMRSLFDSAAPSEYKELRRA
jgi:hypothetical protein